MIHYFDIEADGLLNVVSKVHSLVISNGETTYSCADQVGYTPIEEGLEILSKADVVCGHNIIDYDLPALQKVYPGLTFQGEALDSLVFSRLALPHMALVDHINIIGKKYTLPRDLRGRHTLESWGRRLGEYKGDYNGGWAHWSEEMQHYCEQDVIVTMKLMEHLNSLNFSKESIKLEHEFAKCIFDLQKNGIGFNVTKAEALRKEVAQSHIDLKKKIISVVPPQYDVFIPKRDNKTKGYKKGVPFNKPRIFNPGSRKQIIEHLITKYKWNPVDFTDKGNVKLNGEVLDGLPYDEAPLFSDYLQATKLLGQLSSGEKSWLKLLRAGKIYGRINHNGARTGRCTHSNPNLAQIPRIGNFKGRECRGLFYHTEGVLVGCDASGLELRNLAHYLYPYDKGKYAKKILEGDIHTSNQKDAGLETRDQAKRFIYAFNYGAGDVKLGSIVDPSTTEEEQREIGKRLRASFTHKVDGLGNLLDQIKAVHRTRGWFKGLDGRKLHSVSAHSALNTILQGAGAIIMKKATVLAMDEIKRREWDHHTKLLLHVHDEIQVGTEKHYAEEVGEILADSIRLAGEHFKFRIPLEGEYKIGKNWAETH